MSNAARRREPRSLPTTLPGNATTPPRRTNTNPVTPSAATIPSAENFDANNNPQTQSTQIQDAITTGKYKAFPISGTIVQANNGVIPP